jgi:receptor protein-tyrosine kinase
VQTLLITSASPGEGKSTTLANLAAVFAAAGSRVVVVCCDLRRPQIHRFFKLSNEVGLTSVLLGTHTLEEAIQEVQLPGGYTLEVLASGPLPPNPSEVLGSARAGEVFEQLRQRADYVLLDPPPVVPVTDAVVTSRWADAVICVARMGVTRRRAFGQMLVTLERTAVPVLGVVLTGTGTKRTVKREGYVYRSHRDQSGGLFSRVVHRGPTNAPQPDVEWESLSRAVSETDLPEPAASAVPGNGGPPRPPKPLAADRRRTAR